MLHSMVCWHCQLNECEKCDGRDVVGHACVCGCYYRRLYAPEAPQYLFIRGLYEYIDEPYKSKLENLYDALLMTYPDAPGSRKAHQAIPGGYYHHVTEVANIALQMYRTFSRLRTLPFSLSDVLVAIFLHDIEKPFKHSTQYRRLYAGKGKQWWCKFREGVIEGVGLTIPDPIMNAIRYCEGEGDDYVPGERVMNELAALCHAADVLSARLWYNEGEKGAW